MSRNKDWHHGVTSLFDRLRKPKPQGFLTGSSITTAPTSPADDGSGHSQGQHSSPAEPGAVEGVGSLAMSVDVAENAIEQEGEGQQLSSILLETTDAADPSEQKNFVFNNALNELLPPDIIEAMQESTKDSFMDKVKKAGASGLPIFKNVLKAIKAVSGSQPHLQLAVEGLLKVLEQFDAMKDVNEDLLFASQKMTALQRILDKYNNSDIPKFVKDRMEGVTDWIATLTESINAQKSRSWYNRLYQAEEDHKKVAGLLRSFTSVLELYMIDASITTEGTLGKIETKIDDLGTRTNVTTHLCIYIYIYL